MSLDPKNSLTTVKYDAPHSTVKNDYKNESSKSSTTSHTTSDSGQRKKRTARACDKCSIARTKCDGKRPCYRCISMLIRLFLCLFIFFFFFTFQIAWKTLAFN